MFGISRKRPLKAEAKSHSRSAPQQVAESEIGEDDRSNDIEERPNYNHPSRHDDGRRSEQSSEANKEKQKKKKKNKSSLVATGMLSFDPGDDSGDHHVDSERDRSRRFKKHSQRHGDDYDSKRSKVKRIGSSSNRGGLGYGGVSVMDASEGEEDTGFRVEQQNGERVGEERTINEAGEGHYSKDALEKLKQEQKQTLILPKGQADIDKKSLVRSDGVTNNSESVVTNDIEKQSVHHQEEDFISLPGSIETSNERQGSHDPVILTGDEAIAYANEEEEDTLNEIDLGLPSMPHQSTLINDVKGTKLGKALLSEQEVEDDSRQWENNMARRAGVLPPATTPTKREEGRSHRTHDLQNDELSPSLSLTELKLSIEPAIINLQNIASDIETSLHRNESLLSSTKEEVTKHHSTMEQHGAALEYYQLLREDLAIWIGALRELQSMVHSATAVKSSLHGQISLVLLRRWWEWGEDVAESLDKRGLLEKRIGGTGQSNNKKSINDEVSGVDEFGRDLSSMASVALTKRREQRRRNFRRRQKMDPCSGCGLLLEDHMQYTNEDNISSEEFTEWNQRHQAIDEAVGIIQNVVKDDYRSIFNLFSLFFEWQRKYPHDYKSCFAQMSLINMISVLVKLEFCEQWDGLGLFQWVKYNLMRCDNSKVVCDKLSHTVLSEFRWFREMEVVLKDSPDGILLADIVPNIVQQCYADRLISFFSIDTMIERSDSVDKYSTVYNPFSEYQTKWMCSSFKSLIDFSNSCSTDGFTLSSEKLATCLLSLMKFCVEETTIPIIKAADVVVMKDSFEIKNSKICNDAELKEDVAFAIFIQLKQLCTLVSNVLQHWYPIFYCTANKESITPLLLFIIRDIVSTRILPVLETFQALTLEQPGNDQQIYCNIMKSLIDSISDAIKNAGLMDNEEWMLHSASLQVIMKKMSLEDSP